MIEKVNPQHPDKVADRIAGALVDYVYTWQDNPKVAFEVLLGHGHCFIVAETSFHVSIQTVNEIVERLSGITRVQYIQVGQDADLAKNQKNKIRVGDNGIFKGVPTEGEVRKLSLIARKLYDKFPSDGKYILAGNDLIICQSNASYKQIAVVAQGYNLTVNPLGPWEGGTDVDTGAVNRKLGSDMGEAVTGGGLHGKDLSKADVAVNVYAHLKAQETGKEVNLYCAIGDEEIDGKPYEEIVEIARQYISSIGGFEALAEWGLV